MYPQDVAEKSKGSSVTGSEIAVGNQLPTGQLGSTEGCAQNSNDTMHGSSNCHELAGDNKPVVADRHDEKTHIQICEESNNPQSDITFGIVVPEESNSLDSEKLLRQDNNSKFKFKGFGPRQPQEIKAVAIHAADLFPLIDEDPPKENKPSAVFGREKAAEERKDSLVRFNS